RRALRQPASFPHRAVIIELPFAYGCDGLLYPPASIPEGIFVLPGMEAIPRPGHEKASPPLCRWSF
ncbi:MAG: hypothetical protein PHZ19_12125, partial [Candidatus Thermoplasmatota archaeon]|nr:hypothetical protein [Candidatus Thermoplasmatota archaeon]